jgi:hypothetical protein
LAVLNPCATERRKTAQGQGFRPLEKIQSYRAVVKIVQGADFFYPKDEDLSLGKTALNHIKSLYTNSEFAVGGQPASRPDEGCAGRLKIEEKQCRQYWQGSDGTWWAPHRPRHSMRPLEK